MLHYAYLKKDIKKSLENALQTTPYIPLTCLKGFNIISTALIVGEIGDIQRFSNYRKFASYCGFGIVERKSGTSVNKSSHINKRGNSILRSTFYTLTLTQLNCKTQIYDYYHKPKSKVKHPKKCLVACARKLAVRTYFEMMKCHG